MPDSPADNDFIPPPPSSSGLQSWEDIFHRPLHCGFGLQDVSSFSGHHCGPSRIALSPLYKPWALCVLRLRHSLCNLSHRLITVNHQAAISLMMFVCLFVWSIDRYRWFVNWLYAKGLHWSLCSVDKSRCFHVNVSTSRFICIQYFRDFNNRKSNNLKVLVCFIYGTIRVWRHGWHNLVAWLPENTTTNRLH